MNEAERTEVQILIRETLDFIEHVQNGWDVERAESDGLRDQIARVLGYVYERLR